MIPAVKKRAFRNQLISVWNEKMIFYDHKQKKLAFSVYSCKNKIRAYGKIRSDTDVSREYIHETVGVMQAVTLPGNVADIDGRSQ